MEQEVMMNRIDSCRMRVAGRAGADPSMWARGRNIPWTGCQSIAGPSQHSLTQSCLKAIYHNLHVFELWEETVSQGNPQRHGEKMSPHRKVILMTRTVHFY
uniref:Uncharacterized protein n=1 Tax=Anguilla anguilla TaxID=7936 RepID=A0A0E9Y0K4_ANGAN